MWKVCAIRVWAIYLFNNINNNCRIQGFQNPLFCCLSNIEYVKDGLKYMRLKFYIEGSEKGKQGTVHVEVKEVQYELHGPGALFNAEITEQK